MKHLTSKLRLYVEWWRLWKKELYIWRKSLCRALRPKFTKSLSCWIKLLTKNCNSWIWLISLYIRCICEGVKHIVTKNLFWSYIDILIFSGDKLMNIWKGWITWFWHQRGDNQVIGLTSRRLHLCCVNKSHDWCFQVTSAELLRVGLEKIHYSSYPLKPLKQ